MCVLVKVLKEIEGGGCRGGSSLRFCHHQSSDFRVTLILFSGFFLEVGFIVMSVFSQFEVSRYSVF